METKKKMTHWKEGKRKKKRRKESQKRPAQVIPIMRQRTDQKIIGIKKLELIRQPRFLRLGGDIKDRLVRPKSKTRNQILK